MCALRFQAAGTIFLILLITTSGCKSKPGIAGTWVPSTLPAGIEMTLDIRADGTWSQSMKDGNVTMGASGTYVQDSKSLTMVEKKTTVDGKDKPSAKNWTYKYDVAWVSTDEVRLTQNGIATVYRRKQ